MYTMYFKMFSQQTKSKKIRTVNRRPMVVQRQLLPKSAPSQMLAFVPMSGATGQGQNPASGTTAQGQRSSNGPMPVLPKGVAARVSVSSTGTTCEPFGSSSGLTHNRPIRVNCGTVIWGGENGSPVYDVAVKNVINRKPIYDVLSPQANCMHA